MKNHLYQKSKALGRVFPLGLLVSLPLGSQFAQENTPEGLSPKKMREELSRLQEVTSKLSFYPPLIRETDDQEADQDEKEEKETKESAPEVIQEITEDIGNEIESNTNSPKSPEVNPKARSETRPEEDIISIGQASAIERNPWKRRRDPSL